MLPSANFTPDANHPTDNRLDLYPAIGTNCDYSIRVDHKLGIHDLIWGRYSQVLNASTSQLTTPISQVENLDRKNLVLDWVNISGSRLFVESNYSYQQFPLIINNGFPQNATQALVGIGWNAAQIAAYGLPDMLDGRGNALSTGHYEQGQNSPFSFNESLSWTTGRHTVKFGVNLSRKRFQNIALGHHYTFATNQTENPDRTVPTLAIRAWDSLSTSRAALPRCRCTKATIPRPI